jgi:hypothetical protein
MSKHFRLLLALAPLALPATVTLKIVGIYTAVARDAGVFDGGANLLDQRTAVRILVVAGNTHRAHHRTRTPPFMT